MSIGTLSSWGRYPRFPQTGHGIGWRSELPAELARVAAEHGSLLPFGNGRSYGDSCLATSDQVLHLRPLDRFISADWQTGVIRAEAGVTLDEVLRLAIPRGWFLSVTPGTKFATLGGAVANDVHGKNHHVRGSFGCHVRRFGLVRSDRGRLEVAPGDADGLFAATIGGLGLTGIIDWVELQLMPIKSSLVDVVNIRFDSLDEFFALSRELDGQHEYAVAWIDCAARGASAGRGIYMVGDHAPEGGLAYDDKPKLSVPLVPPISAINSVSLRVFNHFYYNAAKPGRHPGRVGYEPYFYPLDRILHWNRIYGPKGFQQYQCVIPESVGGAAIGDMLGAIAAAHSGSFLAVLKRFGDVASPGLLSFPEAGATLALDFPEHGEATAKLFANLDAIVRAAGGRIYPAKDAHMGGEFFRACYPQWTQLEALRDPALCSRFWKRVTQA
ncbi:MAG: FAD-binding oxidoreductase [Zoogloea sp.]|nr:FAD-binding oxidoreductase [Zoogloea sp.]